MKRMCSITIIFMMLIGMVSCGNGGSTKQNENGALSSEASQDTESKDNANVEEDIVKGTDILVAYFSCTGTTEKIAEYAAEYLNADLYRIDPEEPYSSDDLDYNDSSSKTTKEQNDSSSRPAIAGNVDNMNEYDTIILAYPIWWGQAPRIISTFLESYDFSGKTIVPFCTSQSSGIGNSDTDLHSLCADNVIWKEGMRFSSGTSKDEVAEWLKNQGIEPFVVE